MKKIKIMKLVPKEELKEIEIENSLESLQKEVKPTLTEDERVILMNIAKKYKTIRRIGNNVQVDSEDKEEFACICAFNHLFQFIKERRRIFY